MERLLACQGLIPDGRSSGELRVNEHEIVLLNQATDRSIAGSQRATELGPVLPAQWQSQVADDEGFISPRFVWRVLAQWWYVAIPIGLVLAILSAATVMLTFTPVYRSSAVLKIASYTPYIAYTSNEQPMKPEEFTETQVELLRSPLVMEELLKNPEVAEIPQLLEQENPAAWLAEAVQVKQIGNSELYNVFLDAKAPESSALLVNAILDEYFQVRTRDEESQTKRVLELLEQEKSLRAAEIQEFQTKLRTLAKKLEGDGLLDETSDGLTAAEVGKQYGRLNELRDKLSEANLGRRMAEMEIEALTETINKRDIGIPKVEVENAISDSDEVQQLRALIATKKAMLYRHETASAAGKDDSGYRKLQREIASYERTLSAAANTARPRIHEDLKAMAALERQDLLKQLEQQLELKANFEELLRERVREQLAAVGDTSDQRMELEFTRAELERAERVFEMIAERSMALTTESRAPGRVTLMRPAEEPQGPVESLPIRNLAAAVLISGCFPFGLALLWELSVRRIGDSQQLSQLAALPVVGEIARLPMRFRTITPGDSRAMSLYEESIDSLRVGLVLPDQHQNLKVIAVTSAVHSEGKSSIASQLAVSIGRSIGQPVLLIDGDLRSPDVHHIFDIPNEIGFATVLDGSTTLEEAIVTSWSDSVHLLPAGHLKKNPHKLMSVGILRKILDELRGKYQYIVIDTPPILSASEALLLAKVADGTVLSTRRNSSRESQVRIAYTRLMQAGARPLGAVFNGVPTRSYASTYGNYSYARSFE